MSDTRDYRDHEDFRDVEGGPAFQDWTAGMEQKRPDHTDALDGELTLHRADGAVLTLTLDGREARWHVGTAPTDAAPADGARPDWFARPGGRAAAEVLPLKDGIYFIDLHVGAERPEDETCATVVYDRPAERALIVYSWTFDRGDARRVDSRIDAAGVGAPTPDPIARTADLVGYRAMWVYSDEHAYEHIYLNYGTYAWHCLGGPERSIADVDRAEYYKISDQVFVFFVDETVFPWAGVFVLNFTPGASTNIGRFFGWDPKPNLPAHNTFGATGRMLNHTDYTFGGGAA